MRFNYWSQAFLTVVMGVLFFVPQATLATGIRILPTQHELSFGSTNEDRQAILRVVRSQLNPDQFREVRAQLIRNKIGNPHHILVYLARIGYHQMKIVSLAVDPQFHFLGSNPNYKLQYGDIAQQPGRGIDTPAVCPDAAIQFVSFAPNDVSLEQEVASETGAFAAAHGYKTLMLLKENATRQNYLDVMSCPNLKGNFYDGDSNPTDFIVYDGIIEADELVQYLKAAMKFQVTNIWLACQAFNDPLKSVMIDIVQAQKFAAGINNLLVGPSDQTAMCAMKAALIRLPMTQAIKD
jgi:hypothetical protein